MPLRVFFLSLPMTDKSATTHQPTPPCLKIPAAVRSMLDERKRWHDMLELLEKLQAGNPNVSEGYIQIEWDVFKTTLVTNCAVAAEMLVSVLACICTHRPKMLNKLLPDVVEPLIGMDVLYPNEIMAWYASRETLAPEVRQWVETVFPELLNWVGDSVEGNKELLVFAGLDETEDIRKVAPKHLHMSNYSEAWGTGLYFVLIASPFIAFPIFIFSSEALVICGAIVALIAFFASKVCGEISVEIDMADEIVVRRFLAPPLHYAPEDIRHISLRNVRGKLYFVRTLTSHIFADIEFHDEEDASVRLTGNELTNLMLFLAARNLSSRMGAHASSDGIIPILPVWFGLGDS